MVGDGGYWRIEANYDKGCDVWASRWQVTKENDADRNIWSVDYGLLKRNQQPTKMPCNLEVNKNKMVNFHASPQQSRRSIAENFVPTTIL